MMSCGDTTLPRDFDIFLLCSSRTNPWVMICLETKTVTLQKTMCLFLITCMVHHHAQLLWSAVRTGTSHDVDRSPPDKDQLYQFVRLEVLHTSVTNTLYLMSKETCRKRFAFQNWCPRRSTVKPHIHCVLSSDKLLTARLYRNGANPIIQPVNSKCMYQLNDFMWQKISHWQSPPTVCPMLFD